MNIIPFAFQSHPVRSTLLQGEPWFVAKDLADVLGFRDASSAVQHLEQDERGNLPLEGFARGAIIVNESGLYSLIFQSRKPQARAFRKWVTSEVLPAIRKTGAYGHPPGYAEFLAAKRRELEDVDREIERRTERCYIKIPRDIECIAAITAAVAERRGLPLKTVECLRDASVDQVMAVEYGDPEAIARIASLRTLPTLSR